jgi:chloramphenicol O-acetyltransferase type A
MKPLNTGNWNRKEHFEFFNGFDDPFYGIVAEVDCSVAYHAARNAGHSFFAWYLHKSLTAINEIEEFLYRIRDGEVVLCDEVHASATIGRDDGTFGFSFIPYSSDFHNFNSDLKAEIVAVKKSKGIRLTEETGRIDVVHYSSIPWFSFSGLSHPQNLSNKSGIPRITFGKAREKGSTMVMPVAIHVHHGLVDGLHVAKYLDHFQHLLNV